MSSLLPAALTLAGNNSPNLSYTFSFTSELETEEASATSDYFSLPGLLITSASVFWRLVSRASSSSAMPAKSSPRYTTIPRRRRRARLSDGCVGGGVVLGILLWLGSELVVASFGNKVMGIRLRHDEGPSNPPC